MYNAFIVEYCDVLYNKNENTGSEVYYEIYRINILTEGPYPYGLLKGGAKLFLRVLIDICQLVLFFVGCYYFSLALFSLTVTQKEKKLNIDNTFALLVAAHNEEAVVNDIVESLKKLDYPKDKYQIFVVADNCTDKTAEIAKKAGATVLERFDKTKIGKGYAMEFAFEKVFALPDNFEYICVFDADNLVKPDFLIHMNNKINEGYRAVQGYLDSKNPTDSWLTFSYSMWYWINNRLSQLSRGNLDLGCRLGGTGFAVSSELIREFGWGATCLAEDTEFTLKLALSDIKVGWAHDAVVYDEKPKQLSTSMKQRKRWMQGLADVASHYVKPLAEKCVKEKSVSAFHMLMNFWSDSLYPVTFIFFASVYLMIFFAEKNSVLFELFCSMWTEPWRLVLLTALVWGNIVVVFAGLYNDKKLDINIAKNFWGFAIYLITWIPVGIIGILKKDDKEWFHTPHSSKEK